MLVKIATLAAPMSLSLSVITHLLMKVLVKGLVKSSQVKATNCGAFSVWYMFFIVGNSCRRENKLEPD